MRLVIATGSVLLALAGPAVAQPGMQPGASRVEPSRSEGVALALSAGGTLASWGLVLAAARIEGDLGERMAVVGVAGAVILPSLGPWYAGARVTRGMGLRLAGGAAFTIAGYLWLVEENDNSPDAPGGSPWLAGIVIAGAAAFIVGTIDDIVTAPSRVRRRNEARGLALVPIAGGRAAGFAIGGRF